MTQIPCTTCNGKGYLKHGEGPKADYGKCWRCNGTKTQPEKYGTGLRISPTARAHQVEDK